MWDNPPLLRNISNALFFFSVLVVLYGAVYYVVHMPKVLPIQSVRLTGVPQRIELADLLKVVRREVRGNFLTVDINRLRKSLEKQPWVRRVSIRREFPNRLAVQFEEYKALARWNDEALVNSQGEVFVAETKQNLPRLTGMEGSAVEVVQQYVKFSERMAPLHLQVTQLSLSPRHAWQMHLSNGMAVELGREAMDARLARFVAVYPYGLGALSGRLPGLPVVDMRYRHGYAVHE